MSVNNLHITKSFRIKNLVCDSSILLLTEVLTQTGFIVHDIKRGYIVLSYDPEKLSETVLNKMLLKYRLEILTSRDEQLVEGVKIAVYELIHQLNNVNSVIQRSEYLVDKLGKSYQYLSKLFSKYEPLTLEKYIIQQKIERVKTLIDQDEFTLSEIAYMMEYSSVQYLSNQFKQITGFSVTEYKQKTERTPPSS